MKNDEGVSPVVGTILMIAATVAIGATVFTAVNAFGGESTEERVSAVFSVKGIDTDSDGYEDKLKVTYTSGPELGAGDYTITVKSADGTKSMTAATGTFAKAGDFLIYDLADPAVSSAGTWLVTVVVKDTLVVDQTVKLNE